MRVLLAIHNVYAEFTSGAARSVQTMIQWLAAEGHACEVLSSAWFEATPGGELRPYLAQCGITPQPRVHASGCGLLEYMLADVAVTAMETRHHTPNVADRVEGRQYLEVFQDIVQRFRPDVVLTYGGHPVLLDAMTLGHAQGASTIRTLRAYGYEDRGWFAHIDRVLAASGYVSRYYRERIGLLSTPIPSPIIWSDVLAPEDTRGFVTFVNPSLHKGAALFARLADMLGQARPDIPILIVQSSRDASVLASIPGLDLTRYPQILASPPIPDSRDIYGLTRLLLVPSIFQEPFGRVAAEAMINGIPTLVSDRGGLPDTVGGAGIVLPVPDWMEPIGRRVPDADEVQPWFDAVVRLWDDAAAYQRVAAMARAEAARLYDETLLRERHLAFFTDPGPNPPLFG